MSPPSPRSVTIDPHLPAPNRSHSISISPNALSPSRAIGPHHLSHPGHPHRGNSNHGRSYQDEEGARERQMQQDLESAMSMSRARSGSIAQDASPGMRPSHAHYPSTSPIDEASFPMLSDLEEEEMDRARFHVQGDDASDDEGYRQRRRRSSPQSMEERGEGMMDHGDLRDRDRLSSSSGFDSHSRLLSERDRLDRDRERGLVERGLARSNFDFKAMDDYAEQERNAAIGGGQSAPKWILSGDEGLKKRSRGQSAAGQPGSYSTTFDRTNTMSQYGDDNAADPGSTHRASLENESDRPHDELGGEHSNEGDQPFSPKESVASTTFHRRRQRKLSQSNPVMRRQGKLALFEGFGSLGSANEGSLETPAGFKAPRHPKNLGPASGQPFVPFTDAAPGHDRPYRFSFYSNALPVTIHARSLAELPAEGQTFEDLFKGKNGEGTGESSGDVSNGAVGTGSGTETPVDGMAGQSVNGKMSLLARAAGVAASQHTGNSAQKGAAGVPPSGPPGNADDDPEAFTWWLDVLSPTDEEMRMLSKVFGIHPLTTEDILLEETREKIELFRNYYLVCFRSFDQDPYSQTYLEPLNMYIIVFREGTLSFHFRGTPHPQNVRRRIKHLKDYISVTSDWISYALIDDITDAFGPLIQSIEYEVDSIDELVLILKEAEQSDMLRRIGTCRKKVMGLLRLMGNKADVVKGLAKRCNEQWLVAPKSDIGLYLSDIQDHLITMTQNLNHYEKILSRSHSNYLAQISIEMTDANNQINDVLSKLTALGTVLVPMNLVTGLWGMNVHVPGEDVREGYAWFGGIVGCLGLFAVVGAFATWKCFVR